MDIHNGVEPPVQPDLPRAASPPSFEPASANMIEPENLEIPNPSKSIAPSQSPAAPSIAATNSQDFFAKAYLLLLEVLKLLSGYNVSESMAIPLTTLQDIEKLEDISKEKSDKMNPDDKYAMVIKFIYKDDPGLSEQEKTKKVNQRLNDVISLLRDWEVNKNILKRKWDIGPAMSAGIRRLLIEQDQNQLEMYKNYQFSWEKPSRVETTEETPQKEVSKYVTITTTAHTRKDIIEKGSLLNKAALILGPIFSKEYVNIPGKLTPREQVLDYNKPLKEETQKEVERARIILENFQANKEQLKKDFGIENESEAQSVLRLLNACANDWDLSINWVREFQSLNIQENI